ncbi:ribosome biogenesis protein Nop16 [Cantharellus anzutake]|uniref:ribosome biogenesis protein Nop16 n=1 Tax=Cantharellus anzutake TaxID=1750568 RepID=UPI0019070062|nr:ribosome biogenesis protein Nop16 [Cantharellus anzutake]KAF8329732.1 ribosome biogenesis protein Nop16 [Cantharellus anzutake]
MVNPRQRRKARSGTHRPVRTTNVKKALRKKAKIIGPKVLQEAWDYRKTVHQNYEALGLMAAMAPAKGPSRPTESISLSSLETQEAPTSSTSRTKVPETQMGRLIRDENGNVIDFVLVDDQGGHAAEEWPPKPFEQDGPEPQPIVAKTGIVCALEEHARSESTKFETYLSKHQIKWLRSLVDAHGDNITAMSMDMKRNVWQKTPGELRKLISRAGGIDRIREM